MRAVLTLVGAVAVLAMAALSALAADPAMTIVFSGNSYGYYDPCPTCGPEKLGGLARRSTYFKTLRQGAATAGKTLFVAGAWEFLPEAATTPPEAAKTAAIAQAYGRLGYDAGAVSPAEVALLAKHQAAPPQSFTVLDQEPRTRLVTVGGKTVGLVFFPMPKDPSAPVPDKLMDATAKAAAALRGQAALVVGVSPWGALDEEVFINTRSGAVDVLLGSGGGAGFPAKASKDGKTVWMRAYIKGKTVNRLDLLALPGGKDFTWKPGQTFATEVVTLDAAYAQDQAIEQLF